MFRYTATIICIVTLLLLATGIGWQSDATAQAWPNEPPGSTLVTDWAWSSNCPNGGWNPDWGHCGTIVSDPTAPLSPPSVMEFYRKRDQAEQLVVTGHDLPNLREVYTGYWWKPSNPYFGHSNGFNKISFLQTESSGDYYVAMYGEQGSGNFSTTVVNEWNQVNDTRFANRSACQVTLGKWHRVELYSKVGTSGAKGTLRWWLDGQLCADYSDIDYGTNQTFTYFNLTPSWDGPDGRFYSAVDGWYGSDIWPYPSDLSFRFDHVHISAPNCGTTCGGSNVSDTTPPQPPSKVQVH